jgi:hypothetical protein
MKKFLIVFCSVILIAVVTVFAYNSGKGPAKQKDGITELPQPGNDSLIARGKYLVEKMNYSDRDLEAVAVYLNSK